MTPRLRAVVQTNPFRRISYHVAVAMTRFTLSSRCRINGSRKASGRIVTATTISSSAASNNAINDGLCHFLQGLSLSVWIRDGLGRRRHQHHFFTMMALVALGLMAAQSVAEAGRPVPRVTVSLQRECGNSQRAVVLINATGPGSAIEVNSGMGLTNSYTCIVQFVSTSNNSKMAFSVHKLDLPHSCQSYVKVWGGNENMNQSVQFCEEINDPRGSKAKVFDHNSLYVKIRTDRADWKYGEHRVGFVMTVTALRPSVLVGDNQKRCLRDEYACRGEEHCIHHKFVCDGFNNCGDGSDEKCLYEYDQSYKMARTDETAPESRHR